MVEQLSRVRVVLSLPVRNSSVHAGHPDQLAHRGVLCPSGWGLVLLSCRES